MPGLATVCRVTALSAAALLAATSVASAGVLYWDDNGATTLVSANPNGTWGVDPFWSTSAAGTAATGAYVPGSDTVFVAGTFASGTINANPYTVTLSGTQFANSVNFNNFGTPTLAGTASPSLVLGLGGLTLGPGSSTSGVRGTVTLDATLGTITLAGSQNWSNNTSSTAAPFSLLVNAGVQGSGPGLTTLSISSQAGVTQGTTTINGAISDGAGGGKLALTINTASNLPTTLGGANTFTGPLNLNSGPLTLNTATGSLSSAVTANFNGTNNFTYNNVGATAATSQTLGRVNFNQGEGGVITVRTVAQDVLVTTGAVSRAAGAIGNFNVAGTPGATNSIAITGQATGFMSQGLFFNGAVGGGGQNGQYAYYDTALGSVRGINYGVDANTVTNAGGVAVTGGTNAFVQITGAVTGQTTDTFNTLNISGANSLTLDSTGAGATLTLSNGGLLKTGNSAATISGGAGITTGGAAELVIKTDQAADALTISTPILASSTGGVTKGGLGTVTLSSATGNAYSGTTTVNQGTLALGASNVIPDASDVRIVGAQNTVTGGSSGGVLNLGANSDTVGRVTLDGGAITGTTGVLTGSAYDLRRGVVSGILGGSTGVTKNGLGQVTLTGVNQAYTGTTTVNAGNLLVLFPTAITSNIIAPTSAAVLGGGTMEFRSNGADTQTLASLSLASGDSTLSLTRTATSMTVNLGAISSRAIGSTVNYINAGASNVTLNTTTTNTASGILGGYFTVGASNGTDWARNNGSGSILALAAASYSNTAAPTTATNTDMTASVAFTTNATGSVRFNTNAANTLTLNPGTTAIDSGGILVTANTQGNASTIASGAALTSNTSDLVVIHNNPAGPLTVAADVVNNGAAVVGLTKSGPGTVIVSGNNTFTGGVYVNNGVLQAGSVTALNSTTPNSVNFGSASGGLANGGVNVQSSSYSTPTLRTAGNSVAVASLSTANAFVGNPIVENASATAATLTVGATTGTTTYSGVIQNGAPSTGTAAPLSVVKTGGSTQVFSGASTYSGGTTVTGGVLGGAADGAFGTGNVTINAGGQLTLSTGVTNNYIADTATLSVASTAVVVLNFTGTPDKVASLILNGVTQPSGVYSASTSGGFFSGSGSIMVAPVPEPSTWVMMLGGLGALTMYLRARNKSRKMA